MKNKLNFAIDVDGVVRDVLTQMVFVYNDRYKWYSKTVRVEDFTEYDLLKFNFPEVEDPHWWFFDIMAYETFYLAKPYKDAIQAMKELCNIGTVTLVTKQTTERAMSYTIKWLCDNNVPYNNLCFVKDDKSIVGKEFDYFVDDYIGNFKNSQAKTNILIKQPYNNFNMLPRNVFMRDNLYQFANELKENR